MSKLLINEPPLIVLPSLVKAIGINDAIVLQQIHYWVSQKKHLHDGRYWTYNTYKDWTIQFPHLSERGVREVINRLEKIGLLISNNYNINKYDRTKWYTINYETLDTYCPSMSDHVSSIDHIKTSATDASITETNTETNKTYIGERNNVSLHPNELVKLNNRFGIDLTDRCVDKLSTYMATSPKKARQYKSHYSAILSWVVQSVLQNNPPRMLTKDQITEAEKKWTPIKSKYQFDNELYRLK